MSRSGRKRGEDAAGSADSLTVSRVTRAEVPTASFDTWGRTASESVEPSRERRILLYKAGLLSGRR